LSTVVVLDSKGRIVIPQEVRQKFETNRFTMRTVEGRIELTPLPTPKSLRGKYKIEGSLAEIEELQEQRLLERA